MTALAETRPGVDRSLPMQVRERDDLDRRLLEKPQQGARRVDFQTRGKNDPSFRRGGRSDSGKLRVDDRRQKRLRLRLTKEDREDG